ncbi:MAG: peptidoglycan-binding protein [Hyphomicrobiales bacterium]|nr:peptidoglycan-binding protein [Hyphomicrobiales bacterium]MDE2114571.1 peptidoglycan-binding protein [Hyphomicrobiales bacterium]
MPEALARSDFDFIVRERAEDRRPRKNRDSKRPRTPAAQPAGFARSLLEQHVLSRPGRAIAYGLMGAMTLGILVNALALQKGHRAEILLPLFSSTAPVAPHESADRVVEDGARVNAIAHSEARANSLPELVPLPPQTLPASPHYNTRSANVAASAPAKARPLRGPVDAIAALLQPDAAANSAPAVQKADANVAFVQRALAKLGYPVQADGIFGRSTRLAIARFQHSEKLAQTGDISLKLRERLAARTGLRAP